MSTPGSEICTEWMREYSGLSVIVIVNESMRKTMIMHKSKQGFFSVAAVILQTFL
jgi:hypothetical protein